MPFTQSHAMSIVATALLGTSIAAGLVFGLAACTSDREPSEPQFSESSSTSAEPSANEPPSSNSTTETAEPPKNLTPPIKPEAMKHNTEEGAIAFANYFLDVYEYTGQTLDTKPLEEISGTSCDYCTEVIQNALELKQSGRTLTGYKFTVQVPFSITMMSQFAFGLHGIIEKSSYTIKEAQGVELSTIPSDVMPAGIAVTKTDSGWSVIAFGREEFEQ